MKGSLIIKDIVDNDMCIGCGVCASQCKSDAIKIKINQFGFYTANVVGDCSNECGGDCIRVCPFNPNPTNLVKTENEISSLFFKGKGKWHDKIGKYINTYSGYSVENRFTSSSGGVATYTLIELMRSNIVQHVVSVKARQGSESFYEYSISSSINELVSSAKTKYYPVTLADVLKDIINIDGKVAIVGVGCFIKAIRLAQINDPVLKDKVAFLVGIICGGVKSTFFSEYLSSKAGITKGKFTQPEFRVKNIQGSASDYSYSCVDENNITHIIKMRDVGDMWGTGLFKANACDYCDDVTTELADLSLGDAWLDPYIQDGRGTNVIVTRSKLADEIIRIGMRCGGLVVDELSEERFLSSQQGSFNHRHDGLAYRIKKSKTPSCVIPPKRFASVRLPLLLKIVQSLRMRTREKSLLIWKESKNAYLFDKNMSYTLSLLKIITRLSHYQRAITRRLNKVLSK